MRESFVLGLLFSGICAAQSDSRLRLDRFYVPPDSGNIQAVVELPEGASVRPQGFQLLENVDGTVRATVRSSSLSKFADQNNWKAAMVLDLDISRSISAASLKQIKDATIGFVSRVKFPIALVTFADEVQVAAAFDAPRHEISDAISRLSPTGQTTQLYSGLEQALRLLSNRPMPELQRILVISDGAEESVRGPDSLDRLLKMAQKRRIPIDAIWVPTKMQGARNTLARATDDTGGTLDDATNISSALDQLVDRIDNAWVVTFKRRVSSTGPITRDVGIRVEHDGINSASMPLEIAATALDPPANAWTDSFHKLVAFLTDVKTLWGLLSAVLLSLGYGETYRAIQRKKPELAEKLPRPPWVPKILDHLDTNTDKTHRDDRQQVNPRMTRVAHPGERVLLQTLALQAVKGPFEGRQIRVEKEHFRIGADPDNDLSIPSDDYVSGRHAVIQAADGRWLLTDEGSRNGTFLAGQKLNGGPGRVLQPGDSIQLGASEFRVVLNNARAASASGAQNG